MFKKEIYVARRKKLMADVGSGVLLLLGNEESSMNYRDNVYPFRQDSSFLYFAGIDRPGLALLIHCDEGWTCLYGIEATMDDVVWTGPQTGLQDLAAMSGIERTGDPSVLAGIIRRSTGVLHYLPPYRADNLAKIAGWTGLSTAEVPAKFSVPLVKAVVAERSVKAPEELAEMDKAVNTSNFIQMAAMQQSAPGKSEREVAGLIEGLCASAGGRIGYPVIYTVNGEVLHNHPTAKVLQEGQVILCDAGAETAMHYCGDLTRTYPVSSSFNSLQREMYEVVLGAFEKAKGLLKPGIRYLDVHRAACRELVSGLQQAGLMTGDADEAVEAGAHTLFFQCGLGHMLGLDVHDMEDLGEKYVGYDEVTVQRKDFGWKSLRLGKELQEGFVLTVEPGLYFIPALIDKWTSEKKLASFINYERLPLFRNLSGFRVEDNFVITAKGSRVLGDGLIKTVSEVEAIRKMQQR
ncbi:MAG: M24 family metallopeptidase [Chitinophagaceae bacterium]|nr:MAG: M24 family metallopeptidase [Chitinophagaceae bacterium]